jgi:hypothetical protein
LSVAALTAAILGIAGCYGQTDLASQVGQHDAHLNARGAANTGPASFFFEYWKDSTPQTKLQTPPQAVPGGASGRFGKDINGLDGNTAYSFRLCGKDQSISGDPVCAQTRSFITGSASVQAYGRTSPSPIGEAFMTNIDVNVAAGPLGGSPLGRFYALWVFNGPGGPVGGAALPVGSKTTDNITCLNVQGNVAMIGYRQIPPNSDDVPIKNVLHALVVDGGPAGAGQDRFIATPTFADEDPNDCTIPADVEAATVPLRNGEASVSRTTSTSTLR